MNPTLLAELHPAARPAVTAYLDTLAASYPGSRRARAEIVAEIADGVIEAVRAAGEPGRPVQEAAAAALRAFGDPRALAADLARERTGIVAHRVGVGLLTTGPLIGACWLAALTGGPGSPMVGLRPFDRVPALFTQIPTFPVLLLLIIPAAAVALAGAGRAARLVRLDTRTAAAAALIATGGCVAGDLMLITTGVRMGGAWSTTLLLAVAVSVLRVTLASTGFRRCARLRAAG